MTFDELWKREEWFSEDTSEFELAKAAYKAGEEEARTTVAAALRELRAEMLNYAPVAAIDAAIAALGLTDEALEEKR